MKTKSEILERIEELSRKRRYNVIYLDSLVERIEKETTEHRQTSEKIRVFDAEISELVQELGALK